MPRTSSNTPLSWVVRTALAFAILVILVLFVCEPHFLLPSSPLYQQTIGSGELRLVYLPNTGTTVGFWSLDYQRVTITISQPSGYFRRYNLDRSGFCDTMAVGNLRDTAGGCPSLITVSDTAHQYQQTAGTFYLSELKRLVKGQIIILPKTSGESFDLQREVKSLLDRYNLNAPPPKPIEPGMEHAWLFFIYLTTTSAGVRTERGTWRLSG